MRRDADSSESETSRGGRGSTPLWGNAGKAPPASFEVEDGAIGTGELLHRPPILARNPAKFADGARCVTRGPHGSDQSRVSDSNRRPLLYKRVLYQTELTRRSPARLPASPARDLEARDRGGGRDVERLEGPRIGMLASTSHRSRASRDRPRPSAPSTSDDGRVGDLELEDRSVDRPRRGRRSRPPRASRRSSSVREHRETSAIGRCSTAPAAAFIAAGVSSALR